MRPSFCRRSAVAAGAIETQEDTRYVWTGTDDFSDLGDRVDAAPLPLPDIDAPRRVVLVRHGQSTWNAEGRIQGSSNLSELTAKGIAQAETTRDMLKDDRLDVVYSSPLRRASQTASIIWSDRAPGMNFLPSLREVDLYSFQGLLKHEGQDRFGAQYKQWQTDAANFSIDAHAPVRELWYRASLAWRQLLCAEDDGVCLLVVAHNAVNQALVATALGLPPTYFRRLLQSNAATTVLDFQPSLQGVRVTLDRLNQSPGRPYKPDETGRAARARVVLVRAGATGGSSEGLLLGINDEGCSTLGRMQASKTAEFLMDMQAGAIFSSPLQRATATAASVAQLQELQGHAAPEVAVLPQLTNLDVGSWAGRSARLLRGQPLPPEAESMDAFWARTSEGWDRILAAAGHDGGRSVVVVTHSLVHAALVCKCLGLGQSSLALFRSDPGGVSIIEFPDGVEGEGVIRCLNYTAHLGRWAVPITRDDPDFLDSVCGIEGCF